MKSAVSPRVGRGVVGVVVAKSFKVTGKRMCLRGAWNLRNLFKK